MDQDFTLLGPSGTKNNPVFNGDMKIIGGDAYTQVEDDGTGGTKVATVNDVVKPITVQLDTVTNTSGSYTHTTQTNYVVSSMKPIQIECSNPAAFQDDITVTTANGSITLSCSSVSGTSDVTVTLMKSVLDGEADPEALNPSEFDVLAGRIGNLSSLATTEKSSVVGAVNEVNSNMPKYLSNNSTYTSLETSIQPGDTYTCPYDALYVLQCASDTAGIGAEFTIGGGIVANNSLTNSVCSLVYLKAGSVLTTRNRAGQTYIVRGYWR